jgi:hypothetical protein
MLATAKGKKMRTWTLAIALSLATAAAAQLTPEQAAIIAGDPPAPLQNLQLVDMPRPAGPWRSLFNGRDLRGWQAWLGYADTSLTFRPRTVAPLGTSVDTGEIFRVVRVDGAPAIRAGGRYWGSLATVAELADFHLSLDYKWGPAPDGGVRNNGIVYFSHGQPGAVFGTWMTGMEFQLMHGSNGMAIPMGNRMRAHVTIGQDRTILYPYRRFRLGGRDIDLANGNPAYSVEAANDAERPAGEWNHVDLYVLGNHSIHVVNGVPVMELRDVGELDAAGRRVPMTRGRIQFQSEGAVTYFRNIRVQPIRALPRMVMAR